MVPASPSGGPRPGTPQSHCISLCSWAESAVLSKSQRPHVPVGATVFRSFKLLPLFYPVVLSGCMGVVAGRGGGGPRAEKPHDGIGACPIGRIFRIIQSTALLALLGRWWPRAAKGPVPNCGSQVLLWEDSSEAHSLS